MTFRLCLILSLCVSLCNCVGKTDAVILKPVTFDQLGGWEQDNHAEALAVFKKSCQAIVKTNDRQYLGSDAHFGSLAEWQRLCHALLSLNIIDSFHAKSFFETYFDPYLVTNNGNKKGMFTGYYEPLLHGSLQRHGDYQYPLYKKPNDLHDGAPYYTRKEINAGMLEGKHLELVFLNNPIDRFFLHIQGSGRIALDDGTLLRVGYAAKNGHDYASIGKVLIEKGEIAKADMSAEAIKQWLALYPEKAQNIMEQNPSYVFFRVLANDKGPIGAQGVAVTAERSLAVDKRFIPYGIPLWLQTTIPALEDHHTQETVYHRLMVAQDTGSAIKGPVRGDVFFGHGNRAEKLASHMQQAGEYVMLLPKSIHIEGKPSHE